MKMPADKRPSPSQRITQLTILNQIGQEIAASLHLDQILVQATTLVRKYYGYDHVTYFTLDHERGEVILEARSSIFEEKLPTENRQKIKKGMLGWVVQNKKSLLVNDVKADARHINPFPDINNCQSELTVPVKTGETLIGLLDIQSLQPNAFDETDVLTLETLADQLAVAIENARLHQNVQRELAERIRIERSLQESEASIRTMVDHAPEAIVIWNGETGKFVDANTSAERLFGLNRAALLEVGPIELSPLIQPDGRASASVTLEVIQKTLAGETPVFEYVYQDANGQLVPCEVRLVRLPAADKVLIWGCITNNAVRRQTDRALREREARFRGLAETASDAIITITTDSTIRFFNPAAERIFGFSAEDALGQNLDIIIPEEYGSRHKEAIVRYLQTRVPRILGQTIEIRAQRQNGEIFPVELSLSESEVEGEIIFTGIIRDITKRKRAEQKLSEARETTAIQLNEINHIYDQVPVGLGFLDKNLRFVRLNQRLADINGFPVADHIGKSFREMLPHPNLADEIEPYLQNVLATGHEVRFETKLPMPTNPETNHDWVVTYKPSFGVDEEIMGILGMVMNVTDLKRAEHEANNRAYQQEIIASLSQQALSGQALPWLMDEVVNLTALTLEVAFCKVLELLPGDEELLLKAGVGWQNGLVGHVTVGADLDSQAGFTLVSDGPVIVHNLATDTRFTGPDLLIKHNVVSGLSVVIPGDGRPYGVFSVHTTQLHDFTRNDVNFLQAVANILAVAIQRQQAHEVLIQSESRYRLLIETMNEGLMQVDREDVIQFVNPKFCEMLGYRPEELIGQVSQQILLDDDREREKIKAAIERRQKGISDAYILRVRHKTGRLVWLRVRGSPVYDSVGNLIGTVGIQEDITDSLRAERALQESEARLRKIFQAVPIGVSMIQDRRIMFANDAICQMLGYDEAELVGRNARMFYPDDAAYERIGREKMPKVFANGTATIETQFAAKDGRVLDILLTSSLIDSGGPAAGIISTMLDITQRKNLEAAKKAYEEELETAVVERTQQLQDTQAQLVRQEKMAALGQLAGAVAHELRNPLGAVKNAAYLLNEGTNLPETDFQEALTILGEEVSRVEYIIRQLLEYTQAKPPMPRKTPLNQLLSGVLSNMDWTDDMEVTTQLDESLPRIMVDPDQLRQVFINIIANSLQAMPDGGRLHIESGVEDGRWAVVTITDTGEGIADEDQALLFEPLFTTRTKGIGLGLALVKNIIEAHQGIIHFQSSQGKGTTFTLKLPYAV